MPAPVSLVLTDQLAHIASLQTEAGELLLHGLGDCCIE